MVASAHEQDPPAPHRSVEVERKYDVDVDTPLPRWSPVPGVVRVSGGEERTLDALYLDTADGELARSGVAVRRRTGGPDEGWHIKGPRDGDARLELHWPLGAEDGDQPPTALRDALSRWTSEPLTPLARIENDRVAYLLHGAEGAIAEFVDDHVRTTDLRGGAQRSWREWELELGPAAPADPADRESFFAAAEAAIRAAGGREAASDSKLARALGF